MPSMLYTFKPIAEGALTDLVLIKSLNIDVVLNYWYCYFDPTGTVEGGTGGSSLTAPPDSEVMQWLDGCYSAGLKAILDIRPWCGWTATGPRSPANIPALQAYINKFKAHPALYGWHTDDECSYLYYTIADRIAVYNAIKAVDPFHIVIEVPDQSNPTMTYNAAAHDAESAYQYPLSTATTWAYSQTQYHDYLTAMRAVMPDAANRLFTITSVCIDGDPDEDGVNNRIPLAGNIQTLETISRACGWSGWGIAFYLWDAPISRRTHHPARSYAKDYSYLYADIAAVAALYHENLVMLALGAPTGLVIPIALTAYEPSTFILSESGANPLAEDGRWGAAPTSYTFASAGAKTLYAWAKDAAGNVSAGVSASVTIGATTGTFVIADAVAPASIANVTLTLHGGTLAIDDCASPTSAEAIALTLHMSSGTGIRSPVGSKTYQAYNLAGQPLPVRRFVNGAWT